MAVGLAPVELHKKPQTARFLRGVPHRSGVDDIHNLLPGVHVAVSHKPAQHSPCYLIIAYFKKGRGKLGAAHYMVYQYLCPFAGNAGVQFGRTVGRGRTHHQYLGNAGIFGGGYLVENREQMIQLGTVILELRQNLYAAHREIDHQCGFVPVTVDVLLAAHTACPHAQKLVLLCQLLHNGDHRLRPGHYGDKQLGRSGKHRLVKQPQGRQRLFAATARALRFQTESGTLHPVRIGERMGVELRFARLVVGGSNRLCLLHAALAPLHDLRPAAAVVQLGKFRFLPALAAQQRGNFQYIILAQPGNIQPERNAHAVSGAADSYIVRR